MTHPPKKQEPPLWNGKEEKEGKEGKEGGTGLWPVHSEKIEELEMQIAKLTDLAARAQADLQNSKMRMERETKDLRKFATVPLLLALLPVRDDLMRASKQVTGGNEGLKQILSKLDKVLADAGVMPLDALGKTADTSKHEILNAGPGPKDIVIAVHEEGYELHGKILRPARVQVGDGSGG